MFVSFSQPASTTDTKIELYKIYNVFNEFMVMVMIRCNECFSYKSLNRHDISANEKNPSFFIYFGYTLSLRLTTKPVLALAQAQENLLH